MFAQKMGLDGIKIERAHLVKHNISDSNSNRPRTIVVKVLQCQQIDGTKYIYKQ